jgi:hypothetical protein
MVAFGGTTYTGSFTITAVGGPVSYTVHELGSETYDMSFTIENASGTLPAGGQATITILVPAVVSFTPYVTVEPGGATVGFTYPEGAL